MVFSLLIHNGNCGIPYQNTSRTGLLNLSNGSMYLQLCQTIAYDPYRVHSTSHFLYLAACKQAALHVTMDVFTKTLGKPEV